MGKKPYEHDGGVSLVVTRIPKGMCEIPSLVCVVVGGWTRCRYSVGVVLKAHSKHYIQTKHLHHPHYANNKKAKVLPTAHKLRGRYGT